MMKPDEEQVGKQGVSKSFPSCNPDTAANFPSTALWTLGRNPASGALLKSIQAEMPGASDSCRWKGRESQKERCELRS